MRPILQATCLATLAISAPAVSQDARRQIDANVFMPYRADQYPKFVAAYGVDALTGRMQRGREKSALAVIASGKCDYVEFSDWSSAQSSPGDFVFFIDCRNGSRFYVSESGALARR